MLEAEPAEATEHLRAGDADLALVYDHWRCRCSRRTSS